MVQKLRVLDHAEASARCQRGPLQGRCREISIPAAFPAGLFGGRPIRVVSGYRSRSYARESRHKTGCALDFSIPGVPNSVVRDYLLTLPKVGVGYYPNSSFVHLDVRRQNAFWVDLSGPNEPPRYVKDYSDKKSLDED